MKPTDEWLEFHRNLVVYICSEVSCDVSTFRLLEIKGNNKMQTHVSADLAAGEDALSRLPHARP